MNPLVRGQIRHVDFLDGELRLVDRTIAEQVLGWPEVRRIMTIPGMGATAAAGVMAAIGDVRRFPTPRHLVAYLGLDARVRQSGSAPARHGGISKRGSSEARHLLVEAAWAAIRTPGPLRAFGERIRARRGANIATVAVARKLAVLCWHLLTREEDYAFAGTVALAVEGTAIGQTPSMRSHRHPHPRPGPSSAFAGYRFPPEVITLAVRWYLRFGLSYRDVEELLAERGIEVDHVSIYRVGPAVRAGVRRGSSGPPAHRRGSLARR